ncbi:MAG: hypothetical protein AAFY53_00515 [Pseudomonadota bacterium]
MLAKRLFAQTTSLVTSAALVAAIVVPALSVPTASAEARAVFTDADYRACQAEDLATFQKAIEAITLKAFQGGLKSVDYEGIVRNEWREREVGRVVRARIDLATRDVRKESSLWSLWKSLALRKRSQELATAVAERVYQSDAVNQAISELATGVGEKIGKSVELSTIDASGPAQRCVKAFLGPRYGSTVATSVQRDAREAFKVTDETGKARAGNDQVLLQSAGGLAGAVVILVRRQMARMASRLGTRIVGSVVGRLVSVVAGGVGAVLIIKDVWDLRYGMLPIIQAEMKSAETERKVQNELARSIKEQIELQMTSLASATSDRIVEIWRGFKKAHAKTLELAEGDAAFRNFVDTVGRNNLPRLDEIVALILEKEGPNGVGRALRDGRLHTAVNSLSEDGVAIARQRRSLEDALKWQALAGDKLSEVISLGLHQRAAPDTFDRRTLGQLLAIDNRAAKLKLAAVTPADRDLLFELDRDKLVRLGRGLSEAELKTLSSYLRGLSRDASQIVLVAVAEKPARMRALAPQYVRDAVTRSQDQVAAVRMLVDDGPRLDVTRISQDVTRALNGRVDPILIWERHPIVVGIVGVGLGLLLLMLRGLFFSGRKRKTDPPSKPPAEEAAA